MTHRMAEAGERVLHETRELQRAAKPVPPLFIFGTWRGRLVLTDRRVLFLSAGHSGARQTLARELLGVLTPDVWSDVTLALEAEGSLAIPRERVVSCSAHRRWDFGRYLRLVYRDETSVEQVTSFIPAGVALSDWIDAWLEKLPHG